MSDDPTPPTVPENPENQIAKPSVHSTKLDDWWVITGPAIDLPAGLPAERPAGTTKLLVCFDKIRIFAQVLLNDWTDVIVLCKSFEQHGGHNFHRGKAVLDDSEEEFRFTFFSQTLEHFPSSKNKLLLEFPLENAVGLNYDDRPRVRNVSAVLVRLGTGTGPRGPSYFASRLQTNRPIPNSRLEHLLITAQDLVDEERPDLADEDRLDNARRFVDLVETLLALDTGEPSWQELALQVAALREVLQPLLPGSDRVPHLSPDLYGAVAGSYGPALKIFAGTFEQFANRTFDVKQRKDAARLILDEKADTIRFQALVAKQLDDNFKAATDNVSKAQTSMESQKGRVDEAEKAFNRGLRAWRTQQERQAAMAIAGAVFSFVGGVAKIFAGNPAGAADAAAAAAAAAKAATTIGKLVALMKKLAKLVALIATIVKMCQEIVAAAGKISNAKEFADRMANLEREAESGGLDDAPSASAYWDQLWEEVETALAPARDEGVPGTAEYLKELKVMVIYGRTLTSAQAAIPPIAQEMARASLLAELAKRQHKAVAEQVDKIQEGKPASAMAVLALWLRHRTVQRAMFTALQDFDASHRYWALTVKRPQRKPFRPLKDLAGDLLEIADVQASFNRAVASFNPRPQPFKRVFPVPETAVADFLRDGSFALRFTPEFGPLAGWGDVGRVRVEEIKAWVVWNKGKRPAEGDMEFTIRTDGDYYDQRQGESGEVEKFRFIGARVNLTFRYDPVEAETSRDDSIQSYAKVAEDFRAFYTEPTLFTEWQFSLPNGGGTLNRESLQGAVSGIRLEFSGKYIKDADRFLDEE